jgi:flagellar motor protein MotB
MTHPMPIDFDETSAAETAAPPSPSADEQAIETWCREHKEHWDRTYRQLRRDAQACVRAMSLSPKLNGPEEWEQTVAKSAEDYRSGKALIDQLAAEGLLDPPTAGMLLAIRRGLIEETQAQTASEMMLIDLAVISYANAMRIQTTINNTALIIEREQFGQEPLRVKWKYPYGSENNKIQGLLVENYIGLLRDRLMPLVEKSHRLAREHIEALARLRQTPAVHVERTEAVNLVVVAPKRRAATNASIPSLSAARCVSLANGKLTAMPSPTMGNGSPECRGVGDVRFTKSGHGSARRGMPPCAKSGHMQRSK